METIYRQGVWMAEALQLRTSSYEDFWLVSSHMGDPKAAVLLVFPVVFYIHRRTGIAVLWVAALSEWLNLVLKWYELLCMFENETECQINVWTVNEF